MGRIGKTFQELKQKNEKALVVYLTAGDPDLPTTEALIPALASAGVDIVEIGVPFSDPTADGPVIQAASLRAIKSGATLAKIIEMIERVRQVSDIPIVLFGYYNPIFIFGCEAFALKAKAAGVDGVLIVDLPPEEAAELRRHTDRAGIDFISLIAPTTPDGRIRQITKKAQGFLYYISVTGVTGTAKPDVEDIRRDVARIRKACDLPVAVGFGISTPDQAAEIAPHADGIVVGSAIVKMIEENTGSNDLIERVSTFAAAIKKALPGGIKT
ncbi:MAG: tryptophan synthase subunit alpha [Deltaproteobacteria bacterium HGW-Deltaproteobacteria-11]|nr:MAG: tryptophan synthase subunit alpha [Deltaproteobacteria bacterium HGW-Deltaproteobacteria-11]